MDSSRKKGTKKIRGHVAWFDTACYTRDSILSRLGHGISYSTDKLCLCLGCKAALKGAALHPPLPQDWFQLVPTPLCAGLAPGLKISPCQSPLTQTLPGTDRATKFLPFLNWTACSCHPKLWPLWRGIRDREQPFILPRNKEPSSSEAFAGPGAAAMLGKALLGCLTPSACPGQQGQLWHLAGGFGVLKTSGCSRSHLRLLQRPRMGNCLHVLL